MEGRRKGGTRKDLTSPTYRQTPQLISQLHTPSPPKPIHSSHQHNQSPKLISHSILTIMPPTHPHLMLPPQPFSPSHTPSLTHLPINIFYTINSPIVRPLPYYAPYLPNTPPTKDLTHPPPTKTPATTNTHKIKLLHLIHVTSTPPPINPHSLQS